MNKINSNELNETIGTTLLTKGWPVMVMRCRSAERNLIKKFKTVPDFCLKFFPR